MVEPDAFEVGETWPSRQGCGGAAHRDVRADPVHPADRQGARDPAADRAAGDQQVLRHRPRARPQHGRVLRASRASRCSASPGATRRARHADWGLDTYGAAIIEAMDAVQKIARRRPDRTCWPSAPAACSPRWSPAHLADIGEADRVAGVHPGGDRARPGPGRVRRRGAERTQRPQAAIGRRRTRATSTGATMAEMFAWLRPTDLIWRYWVNNYLQGRTPGAVRHAVLERRHHPDGRRAAPRLGADRVCATRWSQPGGGQHARQRRSTWARSTADAYVIGGIADHISPWQACLPQRARCSAARTTASCCPPAATSPRWSTRPATRRRRFRTAPGRTPTTPSSGWTPRREAAGLLVAGLRRLARRAQRRQSRRTGQTLGGGRLPAARPARPASLRALADSEHRQQDTGRRHRRGTAAGRGHACRRSSAT